MKSIFSILSILLFSIISQAQLSLNPAPVSGSLQITSSQMYIYFTNSGSSVITPSFSIDANAANISIGSNRCTTIQPAQSCYIIVSFPNYGVSTSNFSTVLRNNGVSLATLNYTAMNPVVESSNFSVSSIIVNDFLNYTVSIKNNTLSSKSYNPTFSGTDSFRYAIVTNRCSNIAPKVSCQINFKLNRQFAGIYSASLVEPQVTGSVSISSSITNSTVGVIPVPVMSISVSPNPIVFPTITNLGQSGSQIVTITNTGNTNVSPVVSVEGSGLNIGLNRCLVLVSPGKTCTVSLFFNAVNLMQNGAQSGLMFHAKASNSSPLVSTPVNVSLNINPALLVSSPPSNTNPPYISGLIAMGSDRISRLSSSGALYMSGLLFGGFAGNSSFTLNSSIAPNGTLYKFISTSQNSDYFCGISTSNQTFCSDPYGTDGNYTYYSPDLSGMGGQYFKEVYPGFIEFDFCGITNTNRVYCWGNNDYGQLGTGASIPSSPTYDFSNIPSEIKMNGALAGKTIKKLVAGVQTKCVLASNDQVYCWGDSSNGETGTGSTLPVAEPTQIVMSGTLAGKTIKDISQAANGFCVVSNENKVYCWGANTGALTATAFNSLSAVPVEVQDTNNVLSGKVINQISSGSSHVCVIASNNNIYCWGDNEFGQLGFGIASPSSSIIPPTAVDMLPLAGKTPNSIQSGYKNTCISTTDNSTFCWGRNETSSFGISGSFKTVPTLVPALP